jgi:hypothetical protein
MAQRIPLAWKQLTFHRTKLATALAGVMVAVMLMWVQLGILQSLYNGATVVHRNLNADLVVLSPFGDHEPGEAALHTSAVPRPRQPGRGGGG